MVEPPLLTLSIVIHDDYSHIHHLLTQITHDDSVAHVVYITLNTGMTAQARALMAQFPDCEYIINEAPRGFAANHNAVLRRAQTAYVALLNDDIETEATTFDVLIHYLDDHPEVGLASPRIVFPDGSPHLTAFNDPELLRMIYRISGLGYFTPHGGLIRKVVGRLGIMRRLNVASLANTTTTRFVPVVIGVSMFVRREAYQQAGVMDEETRFYAEEFGWQWRIRHAGWKIALVADTSIMHFNVQQDFKGWKLAEHRKGILNYFLKYRPRWQSMILRSVILAAHTLRAMITAFFNRDEARANWQAAKVAFWHPSAA